MQIQDRRLGIYDNVSFKRPLFFSKVDRPKEGKQLVIKVLRYLYPRIFAKTGEVSLEKYLDRFVNGVLPFRLFLATEHTNR